MEKQAFLVSLASDLGLNCVNFSVLVSFADDWLWPPENIENLWSSCLCIIHLRSFYISCCPRGRKNQISLSLPKLVHLDHYRHNPNTPNENPVKSAHSTASFCWQPAPAPVRAGSLATQMKCHKALGKTSAASHMPRCYVNRS